MHPGHPSDVSAIRRLLPDDDVLMTVAILMLHPYPTSDLKSHPGLACIIHLRSCPYYLIAPP